MSRTCLSFIIVTILIASLVTVATALKCYTCSEITIISTDIKAGDCSRAAMKEITCGINNSCMSLESKGDNLHKIVKRCSNRRDECTFSAGKVSMNLCEDDLCNSAPRMKKDFPGAVMFVSLLAVLIPFVR